MVLISCFKSLIASRFSLNPFSGGALPRGLCISSLLLASSSSPHHQGTYELVSCCSVQNTASHPFSLVILILSLDSSELSITIPHPDSESPDLGFSYSLCVLTRRAAHISVTAEVRQDYNIHTTYIEHIYWDYNNLSVFFTRFERNFKGTLSSTISFIFTLLAWIWCLAQGKHSRHWKYWPNE